MDETDYDEEVELETGVAQCAAGLKEDALVVSGIAIGEGDVTRSPEGPKLWTRDALEPAISTLEGVQLTKNHEHDRVEGVIGEVTEADYKPGVGVLFEAEVYDEEVAEKIQRDLLEVSIHALHSVSRIDEEGRMVIDKVAFLDLSVVPRGEADSNEVEVGALEATALSRQDLADLTDESFGPGDSGRDSEEMANTDDAPTNGADDVASSEDGAEGGSVLANSENAEHDDGEDGLDSSLEESTQSSSAETTQDNKTDTEMTDEETEDEVSDAELNEEAPDADEEVSEEELDANEAEELDEETEEAEEAPESDDEDLEARVAELEETIQALREENEELLSEVEDVRMEYAEALSAGSAFSAEELADKFTASELSAKYAEADDVELAETTPTPAPQTGGLSDTEEEELEEADDDELDEQIAELEAQVEQYEEAGWEAAAEEFRTQLAELKDDE